MLHRKTQQMADWPRDIPVISSFTKGFLWVSYGFPMVGTTKVIDRPGLCARCATGPRSLHSGPALGLQQRGGIRNVDPQRPLDDLVVPLGNLHMSLYDSILVGCRWSIMRCMYIYISIYYTQMYWTADSDWQLFFARYPKPPWMSCGIVIFLSSPEWNLRKDGGFETFYLMGSQKGLQIFFGKMPSGWFEGLKQPSRKDLRW